VILPNNSGCPGSCRILSGQDQLAAAAQHSDRRFLGLAGLPLLRKLRYGGDADVFWLRRPRMARPSRKRKP